MKAKFIFPYVILGMGLLFPSVRTNGQTENKQKKPGTEIIQLPKIKISNPGLDLSNLPIASFSNKYDSEFYSFMDEMYLDKKAESLCEKYMENMLAAQQRLGPLLGTRGYRAAVRRELPGAPVGLHCVYGQCTQLSRALSEMGDTLTIVPPDARRACAQFKYQMRGKYSAPEYAGCIREGRMYSSDAAYNKALKQYLARRNIKPDAADSIRACATADFARKNFSADELEAGTMMVVPRYRGSKTKFHMIMFLGRGRIENGQFVADPSGRHVYTGHNRETIGYLFDQWDVSNVFAADTKKIARVEYAKEWKRIESKSREELIEMLVKNYDFRQEDLKDLPQVVLLQMVRKLYFKDQLPEMQTQQPENVIAMHNAAQQMPQMLMGNKFQHSM